MSLTIDELHRAFEKEGYICERDLAITTFLVLKLGKPLLVEGAPGVGKTEIAKVLSRVFTADLIRLISETIDWARALVALNADALEPEVIGRTVGVVLKNKEGLDLLERQSGFREVADYARSGLAGGEKA